MHRIRTLDGCVGSHQDQRFLEIPLLLEQCIHGQGAGLHRRSGPLHSSGDERLKSTRPHPAEESGLRPKRAPRQGQISRNNGLHQRPGELHFAIGLEIHDRLTDLTLTQLHGERCGIALGGQKTERS